MTLDMDGLISSSITEDKTHSLGFIKEEVARAFPGSNGIEKSRTSLEYINEMVNSTSLSHKALVHGIRCFLTVVGCHIDPSGQVSVAKQPFLDFSEQIAHSPLDIYYEMVLINENQLEALLSIQTHVSAESFVTLCDTLSDLALNPLLTNSIATLFPSLLSLICATWLHSLHFYEQHLSSDSPFSTLSSNEDQSDHILHVLVALIRLSAYSTRFIPFLRILFVHPNLQTPWQIFDFSRDYHLLVLHDLLSLIPPSQLPKHWSVCPPNVSHQMKIANRAGIRLLAWRLVRKWNGLFSATGDSLREAWIHQPDQDNKTNGQDEPRPNIDEASRRDSLLKWHDVIDSQYLSQGNLLVKIRCSHVDAWTLPVAEFQYQGLWADKLNSLLSIEIPPTSDPNIPDTPVLENLGDFPRFADLAHLFASVHGILTPTESVVLKKPVKSTVIASGPVFAPTPTAISSLKFLASCLSYRYPTILKSAPCSGKLTLLHKLASQVGAQRPVSLSLSDPSITASSLIGSLASSPRSPGKFEFAEGALTRALRMGRWIVFRDIDKASQDVLVLLKSIAERMLSDLPGAIHADNTWVEGSAGFMMFATISSTSLTPQIPSSSTMESKTFFGEDSWITIHVPEPTEEEKYSIISKMFEGEQNWNILGTLVATWQEILTAPAAGRFMSFRDLIRLCHRVLLNYKTIQPPPESVTSNPVFQDEVFIEGVDVFLGHVNPESTASQHFHAVSRILARFFGLSEDRRIWLIQHRIPSMDTENESILRIGRGSLPITSRKTRDRFSKPFALTRPSLRLLEKLLVSVQASEPCLMIGETGTGKTAAVSELAKLSSKDLISLNMSSQTEVDELIGGWKPVSNDTEAKISARHLVNRFIDLFDQTFGLRKNADFIAAVNKAAEKKRWSRLSMLFREAGRMAQSKGIELEENPQFSSSGSSQHSPKRRRLNVSQALSASWKTFMQEASSFDSAVRKDNEKNALAFSFVEGPLVEALRNGSWILLDEVNLASQETLESLSVLLQSSDSSITLTDRGDLEPVSRHPDFRLFACMNPGNDVGKRDLPPALRTKFTEFWVPPPDADKDALVQIVENRIGLVSVGDRGIILDVAELYKGIRAKALSGSLSDGSNQPPLYSMRTLTRALDYAVQISTIYGLRRSLLEGFIMAFTMSLNPESKIALEELFVQHLLDGRGSIKSITSQIPNLPASVDPDSIVTIGPFHLHKGNLPASARPDYILTPSVQEKLLNISRVLISRAYPVLIQGPTSAGKTSIIEYLANRTGNRFVRINNHEHTDIQEYLGAYTTDPETGKLVFREGILVSALREGHWIVLDELNLAPSDVLEALNRLLDDNRELYLPETQEVIRPHPNFMLFATQNPPGAYGGRKALSRAFRNRFLEFHFEDVPQDELENILCEKSQIAPSYSKKIVAVFLELQRFRQSERMFEQRQSFATLRDLFRWGGRGAVGYQKLAEDGFMLLGERARREEDKQIVKTVIENIMKVKIDENDLYDYSSHPPMIKATSVSGSTPVWTCPMRRLYSLVAAAIYRNEPVLLVGETGSGKTSVCQIVADSLGQQLRTLNCHQNTETSDILGGQRPVRNRQGRQERLKSLAIEQLRDSATDEELMSTSIEELCKCLEQQVSQSSHISQQKQLIKEMKQSVALFEWNDGPLVRALRDGDVFLLDEISLAEDSVLERLNSVLEPSRSLVLAERGGDSAEEAFLIAPPGFQLLATMNPGGDYGKKELSPALRNRFTEIWVPPITDDVDLIQILDAQWHDEKLKHFSHSMMEFRKHVNYLINCFSHSSSKDSIGLRDMLSWASFINASKDKEDEGFLHGALMSIVDGLGAHPAASGLTEFAITRLRSECIAKLKSLASTTFLDSSMEITDTVTSFGIGPFSIPKAKELEHPPIYSFLAETVLHNAFKIIRGMQLQRSILLEGSPGVGKTSLLVAIAAACNRRLVRINLSEQTDLTELFGNDLPVEGGGAGEFAWRRAPFLDAMTRGDWVLLDEMNLASQSVLEGLNSCLDHRGEVFIPELSCSFPRHPEFKIFACQNPLSQGGGRKGLPKSFVDRFTKVFMDDLTESDYLAISRTLHTEFSEDYLTKVIEFTRQISVLTTKKLGMSGGPWEFNLRDILRWLKLASTLRDGGAGFAHPSIFADILYVQRFRREKDRDIIVKCFEDVFKLKFEDALDPSFHLTPSHLNIGICSLKRADKFALDETKRLIMPCTKFLRPMQALAVSVSEGWLSIVTGSSNTGKSSLVRSLATFSGSKLFEYASSNQTDTTDILGSFEQTSERKQLLEIFESLVQHLHIRIKEALLSDHTSAPEDSSAALTQAISVQEELLSSPQFYSYESCIECARNLLPYLEDSISLSLKHDLSALEEERCNCRFRWIDGILTQAMVKGSWILLKNANLCNPSILDRLNAVFEPNGKLSLSERGVLNSSAPVIIPHPNFRLFLTVDQKYGELSRAMRNRGIELNLDELDSVHDDSITHSQKHLRASKPISAESPSQILLENPDLQRLSCLIPRTVTPRILSSVFQHLVGWSGSSDFGLLLRLLEQSATLRFLSTSFVSAFKHKLSERIVQSKSMSIEQMGSNPHAQILDITLVAPKRFQNNSMVNFEKMVTLLSDISLLRGLLDQAPHFTLASGREDPERDRHDFLATQTSQHLLSFLRILLDFCWTVLAKVPEDESLQRKLSTFDGLVSMALESYVVSDAARICNFRLLKILQWIDTALQSFSKQHTKDTIVLRRKLSEIGRLIEPKTGRFMEPIWRNMRFPITNWPPWDILKKFWAIESALLTPDTRRLALQIGATVYQKVLDGLTPNAGVGKDLLSIVSDVTQRSEKETAVYGNSESAESVPRFELISCMANMARLRTIGSAMSKTPISTRVVTIAAADPHMKSFLPLAMLQNLKYTVESSSASYHATLRECVLATVEYLASNSSESTYDALSASTLRKTLEYRYSIHTASISDLESAQYYIPEVMENAVNLAETPECDRFFVLFTLLHKVVQTFFGLPIFSHESICDILSREKGSELFSVSDALIMSATSTFARLHKVDRDSLDAETIGNAFVNVSLLLWELYVPDIPLDPADSQNAYYQYLLRRQHHVYARLCIEMSDNTSYSATKRSVKVQLLLQQLDTLRSAMDELGKIFTREADSSKLFGLFRDLKSASATIMSTPRLLQLLQDIQSSTFSPTIMERIKSNIHSVNALIIRLNTIHSQFADIARPVGVALCLLKIGLTSFLKHVRTSEFKVEANLLRQLVRFPTISVADQSLYNQVLPALELSCAVLKVTSVQNTVERGCKITELELRTLIQSYDTILKRWRDDRMSKEAAQKDAQSLYTMGKMEEDEYDDEQEEARDFMAMFPQYDENDLAPSDTAASATAQAWINADELKCVVYSHLRLFSRSNSSFQGFGYARNKMIQALMPSLENCGPKLDMDSESFRLCELKQHKERLTTEVKYRNFYSDENITEVTKANAVVEKIRKDLVSLCERWPEQRVLIDLRDRCDRILSIKACSPVALVLAAIEGLLIHIDEWEEYASSEVSLKDHVNSLTALVVEWRRLELTNWAKLLDTEEEKFNEKISESWLHILDSLVEAEASTLSEEEAEQFTRNFTELIRNFLQNGAVGQFLSRLELIHSFTSLLEHQNTIIGISAPQVKAGNILRGLESFFSQFLPNVEDYMKKCRTEASKELNSLIRLASWKDVNVHALRTSAKKSHSQLHKVVKKFRQNLQKPVSDFIQLPSRPPSVKAMSLLSPLTQPQVFSVPPTSLGIQSNISEHLRNLDATFTSARNLVSRITTEWDLNTQHPSLDYFIEEINDTSQSLRDEKLSGSAKEERAKQERNLVTRKRRALADLLKAMNHGGLSLNPAETIYERLQNPVNLFQIPSISDASDLHVDTTFSLSEACEIYFLRVVTLLPTVKQLSLSQHEDLTKAEIHKMVGVIFSLFSIAFQNKELLGRVTQDLSAIRALNSRFSVVSSGQDTLPTGDNAFCFPSKEYKAVGNHICRVTDALKEFRSIADEAEFRHVSEEDVAEMAQLDNMTQILKDLEGQIEARQKEVDSQKPGICLSSDCHIFETYKEILANVRDLLTSISSRSSAIRTFAFEILSWIERGPWKDKQTFRDQTDPKYFASSLTPWDIHQRIVNALLVVFQSVSSNHTQYSVHAEQDEVLPRHLIRHHSKHLSETLELLRISEILQEIQNFSTAMISSGLSDGKTLCARTSPLIDQYIFLCSKHLDVHLRWLFSVFHLLHDLSVLFCDLGKRGFCKSEPEDGIQGSQDDMGENGMESQGTGIGEGKGKKNVSEEIESEEQLEGLAGDENEDASDDDKDEDNDEEGAMSMEEDNFGGKTKDVKENGQEDQSKSDDERDDVSDKAGDIDPFDPSAVDEKFWADENEKEKNEDAEGKVPETNENQAVETELTSRDDDKNKKDKGKGKDQEQKVPPETQAEEVDDEHSQGEDDERSMEDHEPLDHPEEREVEAPEGDQLDIPDDLDLGADDDGKGVEPERVSGDEIDGDGYESVDGDENNSQDNSELDENYENTSKMQEDDVKGQKEEGIEQEGSLAAQNLDIHPAEPLEYEGIKRRSGTGEDENGNIDEQEVSENHDARFQVEEKQAQETSTAKASERRTPGAGEDQGSASRVEEEPPTEAPELNPLRSLGDAMHEWNRRLRGVEDPMDSTTEEEAVEISKDALEDYPMEFVRDPKEDDLQGVGPANEEQLARSGFLNLNDTNNGIKEHATKEGEENTSDLKQPNRDVKVMNLDDSLTETSNVIPNPQIAPKSSSAPYDMENLRDNIDNIDNLDWEDDTNDISEAGTKLMEWQSGERKLESWEVWKMYCSYTSRFQANLTEQLQLVLEPTLATRLRGDYRTGKRLNMRKVIPYIASDFTKDKIWLRRTRPSGRAYQVLLAMDDSQSMADSNVVHLAFQTLALVSGALGRLEVGEIGVTKFGETAQVVHGLEKGLITDEKGAQIVDSFTFSQQGTNIRSLLENSLSELSRARERRSFGVELWQLMLIVSDGICHEIEQIAALLRKAREQKVLVVFVVVDSINRQHTESSSSTSILDMQTVSFADGDVKMERYLDTFPFEHYIVLRNVEALPDALSRTLRQFFERASMDQ